MAMTRVLDKTLWPCQIDTDFVSIDDSFERQAWLKANVGAQHIAWHLTSPAMSEQRWHFAREQDAILFQLRWA
jgi:hypothetical protein